MSKLIDIAKGWLNVAFPTEQSQRLFEKRIEICDRCPHKAQITPMGQKVISILNSAANTFYCNKCMCPLASSLTVPLKYCPDGRFPAEENE